MLKSIQKWLHNNIKKKYGFGWLYMDFFLTFSNTFDRWLYFVWSSFLVAIKDWIKDLLIYSYKMIKKILSILEFRSIAQPSFVFQFIGARKWKKSRSILLLRLVNLTDAPAPIAGRYWRERKCVARRTVRGATQECL